VSATTQASTPVRTKRSVPPGLALFLIAPVIGELVSGSTSIFEFLDPITTVTIFMLYGFGALVARELVVRWGRGWPSLLALGAAYGIFEEGTLVQSFFDPTWKDLGVLADYGWFAGMNWVWTENLIVFHSLISVGASVTLVNVLMPDRRHDRWLTRGWWWVSGVGLALVWVLWETYTVYEPGWWRLACLIGIGGLAVFARRFPDPVQLIAPPSVPVRPRPVGYFLLGFFGWVGQSVLIFGPAEGGTLSPGLVVVALVLWGVGIGAWVLFRNRAGSAWTDRDRVALASGGLVFFLILDPLATMDPISAATNAVLGLLLVGVAVRVRRCSLGNADHAFLGDGGDERP
jgi:hypothetical protein